MKKMWNYPSPWQTLRPTEWLITQFVSFWMTRKHSFISSCEHWGLERGSVAGSSLTMQVNTWSSEYTLVLEMILCNQLDNALHTTRHGFKVNTVKAHTEGKIQAPLLRGLKSITDQIRSWARQHRGMSEERKKNCSVSQILWPPGDSYL